VLLVTVIPKLVAAESIEVRTVEVDVTAGRDKVEVTLL
jgi:hypothetical protein